MVAALCWEHTAAEYAAAGATWGTTSRTPFDETWYDDLRGEVDAGPPSV